MNGWTKGDSDVIAEHIAEQFATDWLLVIENDYDSWTQLMSEVKDLNYDPISVSAFLREEWDVLVDQMADAIEDKVSEIASLLLRQMLLMGDQAWNVIAKYVIERAKEQA